MLRTAAEGPGFYTRQLTALLSHASRLQVTTACQHHQVARRHGGLAEPPQLGLVAALLAEAEQHVRAQPQLERPAVLPAHLVGA